jgi:hypothetical protein
MAISFQCQCGRKFRTGDEHAGRSATCPDCRVQLVVPAATGPEAAPQSILPPPIPDENPSAPDQSEYGMQSEEVAPIRRRSSAPAPYERPGRDDRNDLDDRNDRDDDYNRRRPYYRRDDIRDRIIRRPQSSQNLWTEGGVLKGLGLMALGAVITVGGLAVGWLIFPGPILFIAGVICLVKGIGQGKA